MYKFNVFLLLVATSLLSCTPSDDFSTTCPSGDCEASMEIPGELDENGYYHVKLDWNREYYPYFNVDLYAETVDSVYFYNNIPVVEAYFDSNLIWTVGDTLVMPDYTYNPFTSDITSSGTIIPGDRTEVLLTMHRGTKINVAANPEWRSYFRDSGTAGILYSRKILGPFPPESIGDTVTLYMEVFWDAGVESQIKNHYKQKFIVE